MIMCKTVALVRNWEELLDALEEVPDMREWVLQRYLDRPLLINGHKFHLRVYVLCVGALKVYVFDRILALLAAHSYDSSDMSDIYKHLTNTARSAEDINFEEIKFVKVRILMISWPTYVTSRWSGFFVVAR
jgi:tubulin--tyrosine ligase